MTEELRQQEFLRLLREDFLVETTSEDEPPLVSLSLHRKLAERLFAQGYQIYGFVVASHFLGVPAKKEGEEGVPEHFEVATGLRTVGAATHLAVWRVKVPLGQEVESLVSLYPGADWQEREQFDLVGVRFSQHPDLRRLLLPEDWEGHPLRKDYAIETSCAPWR